jgi:hypothetical protein
VPTSEVYILGHTKGPSTSGLRPLLAACRVGYSSSSVLFQCLKSWRATPCCSHSPSLMLSRSWLISQCAKMMRHLIPQGGTPNPLQVVWVRFTPLALHQAGICQWSHRAHGAFFHG